MRIHARIGIVVVLAIVVGAVMYNKKAARQPADRMADSAVVASSQIPADGVASATSGTRAAGAADAAPTTQPASDSQPAKALPRLVCVGAGKCIPCRAMEPIREQIKKEYAGKLVVEYYDISKNEVYADAYRVQIIPTSIFYDPAGREVDRFEGFIGKEDILAKFRQAGMTLE